MTAIKDEPFAGASQLKFLGKISSNTNCIITCRWVNGVNRTSSVMFTLNPRMNLERTLPKSDGPVRQAIERDSQYMKQTLEDHAVLPERVGADTKETQCFVSEGPDLARLFFRLYDSLQDNIVFSDGGNSSKEKGASVLEALRFTHEVYPAAVHQYLSPNDNKLHGRAKRSWRTAFHDFTYDVYCSIKLLHLLNRDTLAHSKTWFDRNILKLDRDSVAELIGGKQAQKSADIRVKCERAYKIFQGMDMRSPEQIGTPLQELEGTLDGEFYATSSSRRRNSCQTLKD